MTDSPPSRSDRKGGSLFPPLHFDRVAFFSDVDAQRCAELVGKPRGFVDVSAEEKRRLLALDPRAQRRTARMLAGSVFIEPCAVRRKMNHQMKPGDSVERRESLRDLLLGVFAGSLERSDVAIAEARPGRGIRLQHAAMKIHEAEAPAEFANVVVGLVISGQAHA